MLQLIQEKEEPSNNINNTSHSSCPTVLGSWILDKLTEPTSFQNSILHVFWNKSNCKYLVNRPRVKRNEVMVYIFF